MMTDYRTEEQWETMTDNMINGNWKDAAQNAVDFGFYANDIGSRLQDEEWEGQNPPAIDFITLAEMAAEIRYKKEI